MTHPPLAVLDSSVGVKWIKPESGREAARALLADHGEGRLRIVVASHFLHEVVAVAARHGGVELGGSAWNSLRLAELTVVSLDGTVAGAAFDRCGSLGCSFYDALAPGLADLLDATLYSADARAHSRFPGVVLV